MMMRKVTVERERSGVKREKGREKERGRERGGMEGGEREGGGGEGGEEDVEGTGADGDRGVRTSRFDEGLFVGGMFGGSPLHVDQACRFRSSQLSDTFILICVTPI